MYLVFSSCWRLIFNNHRRYMHWFVVNAAGAGYRIEPVKTNHLQMPKQIDSISWDNEKFPIVSDVNFARVCKHLAWLVVGAKVPWHGRLRACSLVGPPICGLYAGRTPLSKRRTNLCLPAMKCKHFADSWLFFISENSIYTPESCHSFFQACLSPCYWRCIGPILLKRGSLEWQLCLRNRWGLSCKLLDRGMGSSLLHPHQWPSWWTQCQGR